MSGSQLRVRVGSLDQGHAMGAAWGNGDGVTSTTATMVAQRAPQSTTVILPGMQPLHGPETISDAIPASGDAMAIGMMRICVPAPSARIMTRIATRRSNRWTIAAL